MPSKFFKAKLFGYFNKAKASNRGNQKAVQRINKALGICQHGLDRYMAENGHMLTLLDGELGCTCEDYTYRNSAKRAYTGPCKHMLAFKLMVKAQLEEAGCLPEYRLSNERIYFKWKGLDHSRNVEAMYQASIGFYYFFAATVREIKNIMFLTEKQVGMFLED